MQKHRFGLVACARWEAPHIAEWLTYHRSIGFDHVYLYCNDEMPDELFEAAQPFVVADDAFVTFRHWPAQGEQRRMYLDFLKRNVSDCEWLMLLDLDEFLCLRGVDDIGEFVARQEPEAEAIFFNWLNFGTSGFRERAAGSVLLQYTRRNPWLHPFTKVLIRSSVIPPDFAESSPPRGFWHDWSGVPCRKVNVLGDAMEHYYDDFPRCAEGYLGGDGIHERIINTAVICHFMMKSEQDVDRRIARGLSGEFDDQGMWKEAWEKGALSTLFESMNAEEDLYLRDYWLRTLAQRLRSEPEELHSTALHHR